MALKYTTEQFIELCAKVHDNRYSYSLCEYNGSLNHDFTVCPVTPVCPVPEIGKDSYRGGYNTGFKRGWSDAND